MASNPQDAIPTEAVSQDPTPSEPIPHEPIPMLDLKGEVEELWDEINTAIHRVLRSGQFILGPEVEAFEEEVADYLGVKHAIGVNSGTDALIIGLRALGIGPGDEVITTPFTFFATTEAILHVGATPVFVDIREDTFNIDAGLIEAAISERTKAIVPVHLFGNPAPMSAIMELAREYNLVVLEDAAQSFGARYFGDAPGDSTSPYPMLVGEHTGAIGDVGAFSFYPTKNLGAYGDAGLITTSNPEIAASARSLRNHGADPANRYYSSRIGYNSRLDALQAAILRVKLPHVATWVKARTARAATYSRLFRDRPNARPPIAYRGHVFHQYTVRVPIDLRDNLHEALRAQGIATSVFYPFPVYDMPAVTATPTTCPVATDLAARVLSLPIHPALTERDQLTIRDAFDLRQAP